MREDSRPQKAHIRKRWAIKEFNKVIKSLQEELILNGYVLKKPVWDNLSLEDMPNEKWIEIPNYNGYLISNYSRVKSIPRKNRNSEIILRQSFESMGYLYVTMNSHKEKVHRVIGFSFLKSLMTKQKIQINHIKGYKWYNVLFNLEWSTPGDNQRHAFATGLKKSKKGKLSTSAIAVIQYDLDGRYMKEWGSMGMAAKRLKIDGAPIAKCCKGDINYSQAYGFIWRHKKDDYKQDLPKSEFLIKNKPKFKKRRRTTNLLKKVA